MTVLLDILCLLLILTVIVVVHEAGHALAARAFGVRVTEFFVGMPWGPEAAYTSKRSGIKYGATFALVGGYTKIAGMAAVDESRLPLTLALVQARGRVTVEEVARALGCVDEPGEAELALMTLESWGSIEAWWPEGSRHRRNDAPPAYQTVRRDARGLTVRDRGHDFSGAGGASAGEPFFPPVDADAFLAQERRRTYQGLSVPKRLVVLVAGVVCNLVLACAIFVLYFMLHGVPTVAYEQGVAAVEPDSVAAQAGLSAGDAIVAVGDAQVGSYEDLDAALAAARGKGEVELAFLHEGRPMSATVVLDEDGMLGVEYAVEYRGLGVGQAFQVTLAYIGSVAQAVASLLNPAQAGAVLRDSAGVVGIAALTQDAVAAGMWSILQLVGMLSLSLGWMNLLPIPPLDGGKVAIELVQAVIRRPLSLAAQSAVSMVGIALFVLMFVYMVVQDIGRLIGA